MKQRISTALVVTGIVLVAAVSTATVATWVASDAQASGALTSGTLTLRYDTGHGMTGPVWFDATRPESTVAIDPTSFLASAGDQLRMGQYFDLDAAGDNIAYNLAVDWARDPALTAGVTASYSLTENPGTASAQVVVKSVPLGIPTQITAAGAGTRTFLIDLVLSYADDRGDRAPAETAVTDIGELVVSATQQRAGGQK